MIEIDRLLIELNTFGIDKLNSSVPIRDKKILISLAKQIGVGHFLTENQGKLLVKILDENKEYLIPILAEKISSIDLPTWSRPFRKIEQVRRIYLERDNDDRIFVEFTYNKRLKQQISDLSKHVQGQLLSVGSKAYTLPLTESNIHLVVSNFKSFKFDIDEKIMNFYQEIVEIQKTSKNPIDIFSTTNEKIKQAVSKDVGNIDDTNLIKLNDRRIRYQYEIFPKNPEISLKNSIANRPSHRMWIDNGSRTLTELISALKELDRLPLLIVFNGHESKECLENLKKVQLALDNNSITSNIGIYFRFDNTNDTNKKFNQLVSDTNYNSQLDSSTIVAGIANNKLPKFMVKNTWYPRSVISLTNSFKTNKTSVYCDAVDLQIFYNDRQPIIGGVDALM